MPHHNPSDYERYAAALRSREHYESAGDYYLAASRGRLMRYRPLHDGQADRAGGDSVRPKYLGLGIRNRLAGAVCYRLAGRDRRGAATCDQGLAIVEDVLEYDDYPDDDTDGGPPIGLLHEMIGDCRVIAGRESAAAAYDTAAEYYASADSPMGWQMEDEFDELVRLTIELAAAAGYDIDDRTRERILVTALEDRIQFKRDHYERIVTALLDRGHWRETRTRSYD